jgi:PAS domain S-box-containing protein
MGRSQVFMRIKHWFLHTDTLGQRIARVASGVVILISGMVLLGWVLKLPPLKTLLLGGGTMRANAALGLLLAGMALSLLTCKRRNAAMTRLIQASSIATGAIGLLTLVQYALGWNLGIDEWLFRDPVPHPAMLPPGRMSIPAAVSLSLISLALGLLSGPAQPIERAPAPRPRPHRQPGQRTAIAQSLALIVGVIALQSLLARLFELPSASWLGSAKTTMGAHTAFASGSLAVGVLALSCESGWMQSLLGDAIGSFVARRLLPVLMVTPLMLGWLILQGHQAGWYDANFAISLMSIAFVVTTVGLTVRSAGWLNRGDRDRALDQETIRQQLAEIEAIYHTAPIGLAILDRDLRFVRLNQRLAEINGLSIADHVGRTVREIVPDLAATVEPLFRQVLETGEPLLGLEITGETAAQPGVQRTWIENWYPLKAATGAIIGINAVVQEITQRKQAELALRDKEQQLQQLSDSMPQFVWIANAQAQVQYVNQRWCDYSGLTLEQSCEPDNLFQSHHPEEAQRIFEQWSIALETKQILEYEARLRSRSGDYRWFLMRAVPILDDQGRVQRWYGTSTDIHDRKLHQLNDQFLNELDSQLRQLTDVDAMKWEIVSRLGTYLNLDRALWNEIDWEQGLIRIDRDWHRADLPSHAGTYPLAHLLAPDTQAAHAAGQPLIVRDVTTDPQTAAYAATYQQLKIGALIAYPCIYKGHWAVVLAVNTTAARQWQANEITLIQDITTRIWSLIEQTRAVQALRHSEARFRTLADNIAQFAWTADASGAIDWYNQRWFDYTGTTLEAMQGRGWQSVHHPDHVDRVVERFRHCTATGETWEDTFPLRGRDGQYRWFLSRAIPIRDEQGQILRWFGTNTDITDRVELEERLATQTTELVRTNRLKDEFLAALSHELRTPLNPILGWTQMMKAQTLSPVQTAEALETIERNTRQQITLVNDLLDVSRVIQGKLHLALAPIDLVTVVQRAIATVQFTAQAKQIQIQVQGETALPILGDGDRLQQICWNLLANAIKFTPAGGNVSVVLSRVPQDQGVGAAQVQVIDNGIGIPADFLPHVFEHFRQADGSDTRQYGGLGLGLAIVRHLVELHGGTVAVESAGAGQGATFTVKFPLHPIAAASGDSAAAASAIAPDATAELPPQPDSARAVSGGAVPSTDLSGLHILLVDDDPDNLDLLSFLLQDHGAIVTAFTSAIAALDAVSTQPPDVIISDIAMPQMNGYDFIQQVRTLPTGRPIPALSLTAFGQSTDQATALQSGFNAHITKPVDPLALLALLRQLAQA